MKYVVLTTKHHEGFCLWDSALTDYKATKTPSGKDLVGAVRRGVREQGLKVGFYHSLIDWHHPDFTDRRLSPRSGTTPKRPSSTRAATWPATATTCTARCANC